MRTSAKLPGWPQMRVHVEPAIYGKLFTLAAAEAAGGENNQTYHASKITTEALRIYFEQRQDTD